MGVVRVNLQYGKRAIISPNFRSQCFIIYFLPTPSHPAPGVVHRPRINLVVHGCVHGRVHGRILRRTLWLVVLLLLPDVRIVRRPRVDLIVDRRVRVAIHG